MKKISGANKNVIEHIKRELQLTDIDDISEYLYENAYVCIYEFDIEKDYGFTRIANFAFYDIVSLENLLAYNVEIKLLTPEEFFSVFPAFVKKEFMEEIQKLCAENNVDIKNPKVLFIVFERYKRRYKRKTGFGYYHFVIVPSTKNL